MSEFSATGVVRYLLDRELLGPSSVVGGRLRVEDVSRSNHVFVVTEDDGQCFVLKAAGATGELGVAREAAVLERLRSLGSLASFLPPVVAHDGAESVLIVRSATEARDLTDHHARGRFSCALAGQAGRALALVHALAPAALVGLPHAPRPSWTVQVHRPDLDALFSLSPAALELLRIVQSRDQLCVRLDELLASWSERSVIHGDVRWNNCLALRSGGANRWTRLQLIDWEHCRAGDPAYDVGAFFGEYLCAWLQSIPVPDPDNPGRLLRHARQPLRRMRPALRAFWAAYTRGRRPTPAYLRRAMRYTAVRLLTAALEEAQMHAELRASALYLLPLSENILRRPDDAAALLGLTGAGTSR